MKIGRWKSQQCVSLSIAVRLVVLTMLMSTITYGQNVPVPQGDNVRLNLKELDSLNEYVKMQLLVYGLPSVDKSAIVVANARRIGNKQLEAAGLFFLSYSMISSKYGLGVNFSIDSISHLSNKCLVISRSIGYEDGMAFGYLAMIRNYISNEEHEKCWPLFDSLFKLPVTRKRGWIGSEATILYADAREKYGEVVEGLKILNKGLALTDSIRFPNQRGRIWQRLGACYENLHDFKRAQKCSRRALELFYIYKNPNMLSVELANIAGTFYELGEYDSSLNWFYKSLEVSVANKLSYRIGSVEAHLGETLHKLGRYSEALTHFNRAIDVLKSIGANRQANDTRADMAPTLFKTGHYDSAISILERYVRKYDRNEKVDVYIFKRYQALADMYIGNNQYKEASKLQIRLLAIQDTLFKASKLMEIGRLESRFQLQRSEDQIAHLQKEKVLTMQAAERQRNLNIILVAFLGFSLVGLLIILRLFIQKRKLVVDVGRKNQVIEGKSRELEISLETLKNAQRQILMSEKMASLGQLTAGIAHEINNPINFISGGIAGLDATYGSFTKELQLKGVYDSGMNEYDSDIRQMLKTMRNGVNRVTNIVKALSVLAGPGRRDLDLREFPIDEVIDSALLILSPKLSKANITVTKKNKVPAQVKGNEMQITQVLTTLLDNSVHALEDIQSKQIEVCAWIEGAMVSISVIDNGCGISIDDQSHVMNPFFTTKDPDQGIGLGLYSSYSTMKSLGGELKFVSEPGRTEFTLSWPIK